MKIESIAIKELKEAEYNPRTISPEELQGLVNSVRDFGLVENIVINNDLTIISGHQRVEACKRLGWTEVPCLRLDLSKKEERKLNVVLNSPELQGHYDEQKLEVILQELKLDDNYLSLRLDQLEPVLLDFADDERELEDYLDSKGDQEMVKIITSKENAQKIRFAIQKYHKENGTTDDGEALANML